MKHCSGEYIIICDGDDYWIDLNKIQKQFDFMNNNPSYVGCFHPVKIIDFDGNISNQVFKKSKDYKFQDFFSECHIHTCSFLFKREFLKKIPSWFKFIPQGDWALFMVCAFYGNIGLIDDYMAIYRKHVDGVWSKQDRLLRLQKEIKTFDIIGSYFNLQKNLLFRKAQSLRYLKLSSLQRNNKQLSKANYNAFKSIYYWPITKNFEALKSILLFYFRYT